MPGAEFVSRSRTEPLVEEGDSDLFCSLSLIPQAAGFGFDLLGMGRQGFRGRRVHAQTGNYKLEFTAVRWAGWPGLTRAKLRGWAFPFLGCVIVYR